MGVASTPSGLNFTMQGNKALLNWTNTGGSYTKIEVSRWDNVTNTWDVRVTFDPQHADSGGHFVMPYGIDYWTDNNGNQAPWVAVNGSGLPFGRRYRWRVRASNSTGWSGYAYSGYAQTAPITPSSATLQLSGTTAFLQWRKDSTPSSQYVQSFEIWRKVGSGDYTLVKTTGNYTSPDVPNSADEFAGETFTGLTPGETYTFQVNGKSTVGATFVSGKATTASLTVNTAPAAPSGVAAVRSSDSSYAISWANNPATAAPYQSLTVQRWDNVSNAWTTVASLGSGTATTFTDNGTVPNRAYQWRVRANNDTGSSDWGTSSTFQTTPAAPTDLSWRTSGTSIIVTFTSNVSYAAYDTNLRYYKNGVLQSDTIAIAAGASSYTLTSIDPTAMYRFGVRARSTVGGSTASAWLDGTDRAASSAPLAPASLSPDGPAYIFDAARAKAFSWLHVPSNDNSDQTAYEVQYSRNGGAWTSTGKLTSATSTHTFAANVFTNGDSIAWQVRTWGTSATASPWSATATAPTAPTPTVTIMSPDSSTVTTTNLTVSWSFLGKPGGAQVNWEVVLLDSLGQTAETQTGANSSTSVALSTAIADSQTYTVKVRAQDNTGLWSDYATRTFTALFTPPAEADLDASYEEDTGEVWLSLSPETAVPGTSEPITSVRIERQFYDADTDTYSEWEIVQEGIAPDGTISDPTGPVHGDGHYRVTTYSAVPSSRIKASYILPTPTGSHWLYLNGGKDFRQMCRMYANIELSWSSGRDKTLYHFAGRNKPVLYSGKSTTRTLSVSGLVDTQDGASGPGKWLALGEAAGPVLMRAPNNRRMFGSLSDVSVEHQYGTLYKVSFSIEEVYQPWMTF